MRTIGHILAAAFVLMPWCLTPLFSQQNAGSVDKTVTITRRSVDADGSETTETIVKKGKAAQNFDADKYLQAVDQRDGLRRGTPGDGERVRLWRRRLRGHLFCLARHDQRR